MNAYIFDTETTGITDPQIVEAAWLKFSSPETMREEDAFCGRYRPETPIGYGAMATHHITPEMLVDAPLHSEFKLPEDCSYLIGHNVDFDWKAIGSPDVKRICTLALSRSLWPEVDSHTQGAMLYFLEGGQAREMLKNAHSARHDVLICKLILCHIIVKLGNIETWEQLWIESEKARIPTVISFGKHKGTPIKDLPGDYVGWLLRQSDIDPYLSKALQARE